MSTNHHSTARIDLVPPAEDQHRVEQVMAPYIEMLGRAPGGLRMMGVSPTLLEHYAGTIGYYMGHQRLGQPLLTFIRYLVSWQGDCSYCIDLNESFLLNAGLDLDAVRATRDHPEQAPLDDRDRALLLLALDAVDRPEAVTSERIESLRAQDWSDRDMLDAIWHANLNRAFGRTAESFGLSPDNFVG